MRSLIGWLTSVILLLSPLRVIAEPVPPVQIFFGPKASDDPHGLIPNLMRFLDSAQVSIEASVHEVDMIAVAEKLAERAKAGVKVALVVEGDWWNNEKNTAARRVLERSQVSVFPDARKSGLMHNKFFVVDRKRVWTGSTNMTETCLLFNPNNSLWIENADVAANYLAIFHVYQQGKFGKRAVGKWANPHPVVDVHGTRIHTYFSPKDEPLNAIVEWIDQAKTRIDVMCFVFSSQKIGEAIVRAHQRGVVVRVLLDNQFSSDGITKRWPYVPFKEFRKVGIATKFDDEESKLHHKVILIDRAVTITGSFNFSLSAADTNDENMLILESKAITAQYEREYDRLWKLYHGDPGVVPLPERGDEP